MLKLQIPSTRRTITLADSRWEAMAAYRQEHSIRTFTETVDRLIAAGLTVKVATVNKNAKRKAI
jgi:hypothetical protein